MFSPPWRMHSKEVSILFNPAFCCAVLSSSVIGYRTLEPRGIPFVLAYLILPLVLHKATRENLPMNTRTSLAAWLEENPSARIQYRERVISLKQFVGDAILFGTRHGWLFIQNDYINSTFKAYPSVKF